MKRKHTAKGLPAEPLHVNASEAGRDLKNTAVFSVEIWPWVCEECGAVMLASFPGGCINCEVCTQSTVRRGGAKQRVAVVLGKPFPKQMKAEPLRPVG